jgi:hypothetical protein
MTAIHERAAARNNFPASDPVDWKEVAREAWEAPGWREAAVDYHKSCAGLRAIVEIGPEELTQLRRLMADNISVEKAQRKLVERRRDGAAASTVEALVYSLRRGVDALAEPDAARRLAELSDNQLLEVGERLRRFKPEIAQAWSAEDVAVLMQLREQHLK